MGHEQLSSEQTAWREWVLGGYNVVHVGALWVQCGAHGYNVVHMGTFVHIGTIWVQCSASGYNVVQCGTMWCIVGALWVHCGYNAATMESRQIIISRHKNRHHHHHRHIMHQNVTECNNYD